MPSGRLTACPNHAEICHAKNDKKGSPGDVCFTSSSKYSTLKEFAVGWCLTLCKGQGGSVIPRAILSTLMMRMMVGLMGREALTSISSKVMPMMDSSTMARSSWFHLHANNHTQTYTKHTHQHQTQTWVSCFH